MSEGRPQRRIVMKQSIEDYCLCPSPLLYREIEGKALKVCCHDCGAVWMRLVPWSLQEALDDTGDEPGLNKNQEG